MMPSSTSKRPARRFSESLLRGVCGTTFSIMLLALGTAGATVTASSANAQSLTEALVSTYQTNPQLLAERSDLRATDEGVPQAVGRWRPSVDFSGNFGWRNTETNRVSDETRNFYGGEFSVSQNLYEGGATEALTKQAEANVQAARQRLLESEQAIMFEAVTSYMNVLRDQAVLDLNRQNEDRLSRQLEATRDRFEVGEVTRTDVAQAESRLSGAQADRIAAEGDLEVSRALFEQVVGLEAASLAVPEQLPALPGGREEAVALALENNPTIRATTYEFASAEHGVRVEASDLLPSVDLVGSAARNRNVAVDDITQTDYTLTATMTVPIYQQGIATSQIRAARQAASASERRIDQARRDVIEATASTWEIYRSRLAQITANREEVRAAEIALEGVEQEAAVGSRTVLDVLDAEQELLDASVNLVRARRDQIVAHYDLVQSVGSLTAQGLDLPVEIYDPNRYYGAVRDSVYDIGTWNELFPGIVDRQISTE